MAKLSDDPEKDPGITFSDAALTKLCEMSPEAPSFRLKVDRTDTGFRNTLSYEDEEQDGDETIVLQKEGTGQVKLFIDAESFEFFEAGQLRMDFRPGLLMKEFTFQNKNVAKIHIIGETYKLKG